jgi:hypothetical protein
MAEYIEKQKAVDLLIELEKELQQFKPFNGFEHAMYRKLCEAKIAIEKLPAADVVPVLRCKDCKDWELGPGSIPICWETCEPIPANGFCSLGKRKPSADG